MLLKTPEEPNTPYPDVKIADFGKSAHCVRLPAVPNDPQAAASRFLTKKFQVINRLGIPEHESTWTR